MHGVFTAPCWRAGEQARISGQGSCATDLLEFFGTFALSDVVTLQRQLPTHYLDEVLRKQSCTRGQTLRKRNAHTGTSVRQRTKAAVIEEEEEEEEVKLPHNVTFRQHVAQTQSGHDIIHVTVDTLCHPGILKREIKLCGFLEICTAVWHPRGCFFLT